MRNSLVNLPAPSPVKRKSSKLKAPKDTTTNSFIRQRVSGYFSTKHSYVNGTVISFQNNVYRIHFDDGNEEDVQFNDPNAKDGRDLVHMIENYTRFDKGSNTMDHPQKIDDNASNPIGSFRNDCSENQYETRIQFIDSILDSADRVLDSVALSKLSSWVHTDVSALANIHVEASETVSDINTNGYFESLCQLCTLLEETVKVGIRLDLIEESRKELDLENMKYPQSQQATEQVTSLHNAIVAADILLSVMHSVNDARIKHSFELVDSIITLVRIVVKKHFVVCLSGLGHYRESASITTKTNDMLPLPFVKKRRVTLSPVAEIKTRSPLAHTNSPISKYLKKMYQLVLSTAIVSSFSNLMENLDLFIYKVPLDPSPLLQIASICLCTMEISIVDMGKMTEARIIQYGCMNTICRIFSIYKSIRKIIIDEFLSVLKNVPIGKRNGRTFVLNDISQNLKDATAVNLDDMESATGQLVVQNVSVLICELIQSCISRSSCYSGNDSHGTPNCITPPSSLLHHAQITPPENEAVSISSDYQESLTVSVLFSTALLQKCSKRGEEGGASEYRPVLQNLLQDLLQMQVLPEYPAAEIILVMLSKKLCEDMIRCSSISCTGSSCSLEPTYLTTAIDSLGLICSDICAKITVAKKNPLIFPKCVNLNKGEHEWKDPSNSETERNRCFCGRDSYNNTDMLDCDRCHNWFHMSCVRVAKNDLPNRYICDECTMQLWVIDQMGSLITSSKTSLVSDSGEIEVSSQELGHEDKVHIMRTMLIKFLGRKNETVNQRAVSLARNFHLAKFIHEIQDSHIQNEQTEMNLFSKDAIYKYYSSSWNTAVGDSSVQIKEYECEYLSKEGNAKLMLSLNASKSSLVAKFPNVLGVIVTLMGDEGTVSLRKLALKALSQIVCIDPSIMSRIQIRDAVSMRFCDPAISVREAAVSLVGLYVTSVPESAHMYHDSLLNRLSDSGVSVKRRVVKIFKDLLSNNHSYHGRTSVFIKFLEQASNRKEDDSVRDLIQDTFQQLWFGDQKPKGKNRNDHDSREIARQMIDIVSVSKTSDYLAVLVREVIFDQSTNYVEKKSTRRKVSEIAAEGYFISIVHSLIDELLASDDRIMKVKQTSDEHVGTTLVAILSILNLFSEVFPPLLTQNYDPLLPYLKANNNVPRKFEENIVYHVCKILSHVSKSLAPAEVQRLGYSDLPVDLASITKTFPPKACSAAIETLSAFSFQEVSTFEIDGPFSKQLTKLTNIFYSYLLKMKDSASTFSNASIRDKNNIYRALNVISSICCFSTAETNLTEQDLDDIKLVDPSLLKKENLPISSFALFQVYLGKDDILTKCKALRALASIFAVHPRVMLAFEQQGSLSDIMSEKTDPSLQIESLKCWNTILISEETRVESGEAKRQMESKGSITTSKKVSGDQDGDASLIGACCVQHSQRLFAMTSNKNSNVRLHVLLLIETLLRQGQLNPMKTIPHLFSLQGDLWQPNIKEIAQRLILDECERRPETVRQLFCDGIKSCFYFQKKVYGSIHRPTAVVNEGNDNGQVGCIFGQVFTSVISSSRSHTVRLVKSLLSLFNTNKKNTDQKGPQSDFIDSLSMLSFASEVLAYLPYNHLGDVLFLVHSISTVAAVKGFEILSSFVKYLRPFGLYNNEADIDDIDELEKAASKKQPSATTVCKTLCDSGFKSDKFSEICAEASKITLLLRVAAYIKVSYSGVTAARLVDYHPGQTERPTDRGIHRLSNKQEFSSEILDCKSNGVLNLDNSIRQYAEFRQLMRKDHFSGNISSLQ